MLPIETRQAMRVLPDTREAVAAWCGGQVWAEGVIVPVPPGGETHAPDGHWVLRVGDAFHVTDDDTFRGGAA